MRDASPPSEVGSTWATAYDVKAVRSPATTVTRRKVAQVVSVTLRNPSGASRSMPRSRASRSAASWRIEASGAPLPEQLRRFARIYLGSWLATPELIGVLV